MPSNHFLVTEWRGKCKVTGMHCRANSPVPGPFHVLSQPEQINQLIEMFPDSTREDISTSLAVHGTVARAALSLSTTSTNDKDDSDGDHAEPVFPPRSSDYKPASLSELLEDLKDNMSKL